MLIFTLKINLLYIGTPYTNQRYNSILTRYIPASVYIPTYLINIRDNAYWSSNFHKIENVKIARSHYLHVLSLL